MKRRTEPHTTVAEVNIPPTGEDFRIAVEPISPWTLIDACRRIDPSLALARAVIPPGCSFGKSPSICQSIARNLFKTLGFRPFPSDEFSAIRFARLYAESVRRALIPLEKEFAKSTVDLLAFETLCCQFCADRDSSKYLSKRWPLNAQQMIADSIRDTSVPPISRKVRPLSYFDLLDNEEDEAFFSNVNYFVVGGERHLSKPALDEHFDRVSETHVSVQSALQCADLRDVNVRRTDGLGVRNVWKTLNPDLFEHDPNDLEQARKDLGVLMAQLPELLVVLDNTGAPEESHMFTELTNYVISADPRLKKPIVVVRGRGPRSRPMLYALAAKRLRLIEIESDDFETEAALQAGIQNVVTDLLPRVISISLLRQESIARNLASVTRITELIREERKFKDVAHNLQRSGIARTFTQGGLLAVRPEFASAVERATVG